MSLRQEQSEFIRRLPLLILYAFELGYELTPGDTYPYKEHSKRSFHNKGLAIDLHLFKNGRYLKKTEAHLPLGEFWESLHPNCTWGGRFKSPDGNHYSWNEIRKIVK